MQSEEFAQLLVAGWVKVGDVARARAVATAAGLELDYAVSGWLALYEGDLGEARRQLVRVSGRNAGDSDALADALAILARTRSVRNEALGQAFLARARGDSVRSAEQFVEVAQQLPDAAPALLAMAARLETQRGAASRAQSLWDRITTEFANSPEAPEALLEQARAFVRTGNTAQARTMYETLLTEHPRSALVPQARNEWERLQQRIPPTGEYLW
jgi:tetratricopeptide (TPR) repeat protein